MDGRRSQSKRSEHQSTPKGPGVRYPHPVGEDNLQDVTDAKLMRKLNPQVYTEIAQQVTQIKLIRKRVKRAMAQAAKEEKKHQAILAAKERQRKRVQLRIFKIRENIERILHIRKEEELPAQQVLEERRKKKEAAANAKLEAEKRAKELERHRLEMEKERRSQHRMLMKAVEAQRKAEQNVELLHSKKQQSRATGGGKRCVEENLNGNLSAAGGRFSEEVASSNNVPKSSTKEFKKRKADVGSDTKCDGSVSCPKKAKTSKDRSSELSVCRVLLAELEAHQDAWPFLTPVNHKAVPGYKKVIKKPMDFSTIKEKLNNKVYINLASFISDVNLVFDNCEKFNEDNSEIGLAGKSMRMFFVKRWTELLQKK